MAQNLIATWAIWYQISGRFSEITHRICNNYTNSSIFPILHIPFASTVTYFMSSVYTIEMEFAE